MKTYQEQIHEGYQVAFENDVLDISGTARLKRRIVRQNAPHFSENGRISLKVLDRLGREQLRPVVQCEWLQSGTTKLALCRNPYPTQAADRWLLCKPDGVACFSSTSPEIARIHFYSITGSLNAA